VIRRWLVYKVFLEVRDGGRIIPVVPFATWDKTEAEEVFRRLIRDPTHIGDSVSAVVTVDGEEKLRHDFSAHVGSENYIPHNSVIDLGHGGS
jgi:hypothetical protein